MNKRIEGFDWDKGNLRHCQKHGVSTAEIEDLFSRPVLIIPDHTHSQTEQRIRAIGKNSSGKSIFLVFMIREEKGKRLVRPISARYMHKKEIESYEEENPDL